MAEMSRAANAEEFRRAGELQRRRQAIKDSVEVLDWVCASGKDLAAALKHLQEEKVRAVGFEDFKRAAALREAAELLSVIGQHSASNVLDARIIVISDT